MIELAPLYPTVATPLELLSIYEETPVRYIENGINARCPEPSAVALLAFSLNVEARGGSLRFSGFGRSYDASAKAHADYLAGRRTSRANPPGESRHNSWTGCDVDVDGSGVSKAELDAAARESGLTPIGNEGWHYDIVGDFWHVRERHGAAVEAMCCCLAAGLGWFGDDEARALQAYLHMAGADPGPIDGDPGKLTWAALDALGLRRDATYQQAARLRSAPYR